LLLSGLKRGVTNSKEIEARLDKLVIRLIEVKNKFSSISNTLTKSADGQGKHYEQHAAERRKEVYIPATACVTFPPSCPAIYAACAIALETELSNYKKECKRKEAEFRAWAKKFNDLEADAEKVEKLAKHWKNNVGTFRTEMES